MIRPDRGGLLARINLWVFELPALRERREDIEPNIDYELDRHADAQRQQVRFNAEARRAYLEFAASAAAAWNGNFRELSASIARLRATWKPRALPGAVAALLPDAEIDDFDRHQLEHVVDVCRSSATLAEAGRRLFAVSRTKRSVVNDSDRLKKYLRRFVLDWATARGE